jgi:membrane-bound lytic murein transglycosylase D
MNNKRAFNIADVVPEPAESFDTVLAPPGQSLNDVAEAAKVSSAVMKTMNPQYLAQRTPPSSEGAGAQRKWPVRVPRGSGKVATLSLQGDAKQALYRVRFGETLESIADSSGSTTGELAKLNGIKSLERLKSDTILLLPQTRRAATKSDPQVIVVPPGTFRYGDRKRVFYEVRRGDSLAVIATAFGVTQAELLAWNSLDASARLRADMVLQAFVDKNRSLRRVRHLRESEVQLLVVGTPAFYDHFEALNGRVRLVVTCKEADTLASLGKRYDMSVGSMERVNRRSRRDPLIPGEKIIVYTVREQAQRDVPADPVALGTISAPHPELLPGDIQPNAARAPSRSSTSTALD